jgi:TolB-like protein
VIHAIRKLAHEIHGRSVWQVVSVYAVFATLVVAGTRWLTAVMGLPSWTPPLALTLVLALLPLVVATAVVQGGLPWLRIEDAGDPNELRGLTPDEVHVVPEAHPLYGVGVLTWRNTLLGAVTAAALLPGSVVAYLTMWALGIGPVGSLRAQGIIGQGEPIAVATFVNLTDDASLGALVADALESDLSASDLVTVVAGDETPADATVVVTGDIAPRDEGYVISARLVLARSGVSLARFEHDVSEDGDLLRAVEGLADRIRERLGESLRVVRRGPRLATLKTDSAEALRLLGLADRAVMVGDHLTAVELLEGALEIDDGFALAWRSLGALHDQMADTARALDAYRTVVALWAADGGGPRTVRELRERIAELES